MGLPVLLYIRSVITWRTLLQPVVVAEEVEVVVVAAEVEAKTKKNGFPSPSLADWSKMERSRAWKKSTSSLCPSKNSKSSIFSYRRLQRTRWPRCQLFQGSGYRHPWRHYLGK